MTKLNITPGKWERSALNKLRVKSYIPNIMHGTFIPQNSDDTQLIADAGTTYNQCGLLPSELLKQRDELLNNCNQKLSIETTDLQDILHDYKSNKISLFQVKQQILKAIKNAQ